MFRIRHSLLGAAFFACACAAPVSKPDPQLLDRAEQLCLDAQFKDAAPLLREYLLADPENAVAHYYLGRCYLSGDLINLEVARGEITAALDLFHKYGQKSPRERFTDEYFELMCLTDIGKTYFSEIALTIPTWDVSSSERMKAIQDRIKRCETLVDLAKAVNPDAHLTKWLQLNTIDIERSVKTNKH